MLKRNNSRTTRRSQNTSSSDAGPALIAPQMPQNATVLKAIYPSNTTSKRPIDKATSTLGNSKATGTLSSQNGAFFLPSSEFFVVDKDSLVLSESDIFQTNSKSLQKHHHHHHQDEESELFNYSNFGDEKENSHSNASFYSNLVNNNGNNTGTKADHRAAQVLMMKNQLKRAIPPAVASIANIATRSINNTSGNSSSNNAHNIYQHQQNYHHNNHQHTPHHTQQTPSNGTPQSQLLDKGLRHFSAKVCAKVEEKGVTTYNEVADDLVQEIGLEMGKCDHKNIRRRVYDALNVLMAIDIIRKEKKEIRWLGLPNEAADDLRALEAERAALIERNVEKSRNLREVLRRCISLKNLIDRNSNELTASAAFSDKLPLPFILISAARDCHVHCEMLEDRTQYFFEFNTTFQINEDIEIMRLMGLDTARIEKIKSFFPKELVAQVLMLSLNSTNNPNNINTSINCNNNTTTTTTGHRHTNNNNVSLADLAVNNSVFAPMINNEDLNLGELDSFSSSSLSCSSSL